MDDRYVSISQLIEDHCSVSDEMVRYWIRHEGLPVHYAGKSVSSRKARVLIQLSEFNLWMKSRRKKILEETGNIHPRAIEIYEELRKARLNWESLS